MGSPLAHPCVQATHVPVRRIHGMYRVVGGAVRSKRWEVVENKSRDGCKKVLREQALVNCGNGWRVFQCSIVA